MPCVGCCAPGPRVSILCVPLGSVAVYQTYYVSAAVRQLILACLVVEENTSIGCVALGFSRRGSARHGAEEGTAAYAHELLGRAASHELLGRAAPAQRGVARDELAGQHGGGAVCVCVRVRVCVTF